MQYELALLFELTGLDATHKAPADWPGLCASVKEELVEKVKTQKKGRAVFALHARGHALSKARNGPIFRLTEKLLT